MGNILSICIPTYNRGEILIKSLDKMIEVCEKEGINIYVSDNNSPDNTFELMSEYIVRHPIITYHRHNSNIGPDDNFEYVLKMSDTKYRWLMSDTCYFKDIDSVIKDLHDAEWDTYILGGESKSPYRPQAKTVYAESISLMKEVGRHLSWISCMIYNEQLIKNFDFARYKNSSFNQTALIFEPTADCCTHICFDPDTVVYAMPIKKESAWQWHVFDIFYRQWTEMIMSLPIYYPFDAKKKCCQTTGGVNRMYFHAVRRMDGKWNLDDLIRNRFFVKFCGNDFWKLLFLAICPRFILRTVFALGKKIKHTIFHKK